MSTGRQLADLVDRVLDGRYRVLRLLAEGGMSAVYEAEQLNVARRVAIKVLRPEVSTDPEMLARFRSEARIISELRHPNTLKLIDYGSTDDDLLYLVTELLSGEPLSTRLKRGPLSAQETLHVVREVLRSLQEAHERGVIHRDLKPGNLFLEQVSGQTLVKVLDFGIAKMKVQTAADPEQPTTADGMLLGTPAYISPEQVEGTTVDARSDIYSLGAVAYHCLSGTIPFPGEAVAQLMAHVSRPPVPFDELEPPADVPEPLAEMVYRWMSKRPAKRPSGAGAAFDEATAIRDQLFGPSASSGPAVGPRRSGRGWSTALTVAAIGVMIVAGLQLAKGRFNPGARDAGVVMKPVDAGAAIDPIDLEDAGSGDAATNAVDDHGDAGAVVDPVPSDVGLRILKRPLSGRWANEDDVLRVLSRIEPLALDCFRRTQTFASDRTITLTFVVRDAGVSVRVMPSDAPGRAFRRCLSIRMPGSLSWPARQQTSTASLIIGGRTESP